MLRVFSSIRQSLINEGKTSRYVRYAVGEVLLIMVGILLALQVQTWNQNRLLERERQDLIENLKADFQLNLRELDSVIADATSNRDGLVSFLEKASSNDEISDVAELKSLANNSQPLNAFEASIGFYRAAISTGSISLVEDSPLNNLFVKFEHYYSRLREIEMAGRDMAFSDEGLHMEIRKELGSMAILRTTRGWKINIPDAFQLGDDEYRKFVSRKDVYAYFEMRLELKESQIWRMNQLRDVTEQILTALEELD